MNLNQKIHLNTKGKLDSLFSIIEIGSFSIRLVVYENLSFIPKTLFNEKVITNIGNEVSNTGKVSDKSLKLLISQIKRFMKLSLSFTKTTPCILATAAIRNAENKKMIQQVLQEKTSTKLNILSEKKEAELGVQSIQFSYDITDGLVSDLGGGSLELSLVRNKKTNFIASLPLGHIFLQEIGTAHSKEVSYHIKKKLNLVQGLRNLGIKDLYLIGGNCRALAKIHMHITKIKHPLIQDYKIQNKDFFNTIEKKIFVKKSVNEVLLRKLSNSRKNTIPYAFKVLKELSKISKIRNIFFTSFGIREGLIYENIQNKKKVDPFFEQIKKLSQSSISKKMVKKTHKWILKFLENNKIKIDPKITLSACMLLNIARDIHPEIRRIHTIEKIFYYPFSLITRDQRLKLSLLMYFRHSNGLKDAVAKEMAKKLKSQEVQELLFFGQCLRLCYHITAGISDKNLNYCFLKKNGLRLELIVTKKKYLFASDSINRGLNNAAKSIGLKSSKIKFQKL